MRILIPGHVYELDNVEAMMPPQTLTFIHKELNGYGKFITISDGTTNEEVLAVLIDRMKSLQLKAPCAANSKVITNLEESLNCLLARTAERKARGVEGTPKV